MKKRKGKHLALLLAALMVVSLGVNQTASAAEPIAPPAHRTSSHVIERTLTIPNSIHLDVVDENGDALSKGTFQLLDSAGVPVMKFDNAVPHAYYSMDHWNRIFNEQFCDVPVQFMYDTGDYVDSFLYIYQGPNTRDQYRGWDGIHKMAYGPTVEYVSHGDLYDNPKSTITIPANHFCFNVGSGYRRGPDQTLTQILNVDTQSFDLSDIAGKQKMVSVPSSDVPVKLVSQVSPYATTGSIITNEMVASSKDEEYVAITLDLRKFIPEQFREDGSFLGEDGIKPYHYGATRVINDNLTTTAHVRITSGAMTNFVSLDGSTTATVYLKKGDYKPNVQCVHGYRETGKKEDGTSFERQGDDGNFHDRHFPIYNYAKHIITLERPPQTGITVGLLNPGTYTLHQVSAEAGHEVAPDQTFKITNTATPGSMQMLTVVNPKTQHTHKAVLVAGQAPTCGSSGWKDYYQCSCGHFFEDEAAQNEITDLDAWKAEGGQGYLAPTEHSFSDAWTHDATNHWHAATCEHTDQVKDKAAHTYKEWVITVQPTETETGIKERTCTVCNYKETAEIPVLTHTHKTALVAGQAPNCGAAGWKDYYQCACGHFFEDEAAQNEIPNLDAWKAEGGRGYLAPTEHSFSDAWTHDATNHWHAATCEHADQVKDKAAHTYDTWVTTVQPTETETGVKEHSCTVCGYKETAEIPVLTHSHKTVLVAGQAPSCTEAGWKDFYQCSGCNRFFADKDAQSEITDLAAWKAEGGQGYLAPTGHSFGPEWNYDGTNHWHACSCGETADAAAHNWTWVVDKEATASAAGSKHEECSVCGCKKAAVEIPATGTPSKPADPPAASPKTGDAASVGLWSLMAGSSLVGAAYLVWLNRKKKAN